MNPAFFGGANLNNQLGQAHFNFMGQQQQQQQQQFQNDTNNNTMMPPARPPQNGFGSAVLPSPSVPVQPQSENTDNMYTQIIKNTLRNNMANAAASLFGGAPPSSQHQQQQNTLWNALLAHQFNNFQVNNNNQQLNQQPTRSDQARPESLPPRVLSNEDNSKPTGVVSASTSPGMSNSNPMSGDEKVRYWLYGNGHSTTTTQPATLPNVAKSNQIIGNAPIPNGVPVVKETNSMPALPSAPNSRPSSRATAPTQQAASTRPMDGVCFGAPDAKRQRPSGQLCGQMSKEERQKHYEEIINYVIQNVDLISPPKASMSPETAMIAEMSYMSGNSSNPAPATTVEPIAPISPINHALSPPSSLNNNSSSNFYNSFTTSSNVPSMPKKAWLQRLNESSSMSSNQPGVTPQMLTESQISPPISSAANSSEQLRSQSPSQANIYLQPVPCFLAAPKLSKCRDCRLTQSSRPPSEFCRFEGFRRLRRTSRDHILSEGFLTLHDVKQQDESVWLPSAIATQTLSPALAKHIVSQMSSEFLKLCRAELGSLNSLRGNIKSLVWRRHEDRFRELCDVCSTTLFNLHWFCVKCGFVACFECFQQRQHEQLNHLNETRRWLTCLSANRAKHEMDKMLPAVVIPPDCIKQVVSMVEQCVNANGTGIGASEFLEVTSMLNSKQQQNSTSPLDILAEVAARSQSPMIPPRLQNFPANIKHEIIGNGRLVRFLNSYFPDDSATIQTISREFFQNGKPFIVSNINLKSDWSPEYFIKEFGKKQVSLVNCFVSSTVDSFTHADFWKGFSSLKVRPTDGKHHKQHLDNTCLKLKDFPVDSRLSEVMPNHFNDLLNGLPLPVYTSPNGCLNLPAYLPSTFVAPDLGPKLYAAYGTGGQQRVATTALHLDIADAININVVVRPLEDDGGCEREAVRKYVENSSFVAEEFKQRMRQGAVPGALWHLFAAKDCDTLRNFLNSRNLKDQRISVKDAAIRSSVDPIHDQVWYLDDSLLEDLRSQTNVVPYTIIQFEGDGIFIPAGFAHQVRNLHSCVKVAMDFVCPERVAMCRKLTDEFRNLPDSHLNHEDKLQLKNLLYNAMKQIAPQAIAQSQPTPPGSTPGVVYEKKITVPSIGIRPISPSSASVDSSGHRSPNLVIELDQHEANGHTEILAPPPTASLALS